MKKNKNLIIAIDGPAGSGKSTVSRIVASKLNYLYMDTGAMYRALTYKALQEGLDLTDEKGLVNLAKKTSIRLMKNGKVLVDDSDVTKAIRNPEITRNVFYIARAPGVREHMVALQRKIGKDGGVVVEGRDITTVVFPDAEKQIYLDASAKERAVRRHKELKSRGYRSTLKEIEKELHSRDKHDMERKIAPLRIAENAAVIDTTNMNIEEVVEVILDIIITSK